jgi:hypothetical protein
MEDNTFKSQQLFTQLLSCHFYVHLDHPSRTGAARAASLIKVILPFRELVERYLPSFLFLFYLLPFFSISGELGPEKCEVHRFAWTLTSGYSIPHDTPKTLRYCSEIQPCYQIVIRKNHFFLAPHLRRLWLHTSWFAEPWSAANIGFSLNMALDFCTLILWFVRNYNELEVQSNRWVLQKIVTYQEDELINDHYLVSSVF